MSTFIINLSRSFFTLSYCRFFIKNFSNIEQNLSAKIPLLHNFSVSSHFFVQNDGYSTGYPSRPAAGRCTARAAPVQRPARRRSAGPAPLRQLAIVALSPVAAESSPEVCWACPSVSSSSCRSPQSPLKSSPDTCSASCRAIAVWASFSPVTVPEAFPTDTHPRPFSCRPAARRSCSHRPGWPPG